MVKPSLFEVKIELDGGSAHLAAAGELDLASFSQLEREAQALLRKEPRHLVIDLSALTFVDSSGLRLLISLYDRSRSEGWELSLIPPAGSARTIFQISGAEEHLPFVGQAHDAHLSPAECAKDGHSQAGSEGQEARSGDDDLPLVGRDMS